MVKKSRRSVDTVDRISKPVAQRIFHQDTPLINHNRDNRIQATCRIRQISEIKPVAISNIPLAMLHITLHKHLQGISRNLVHLSTNIKCQGMPLRILPIKGHLITNIHRCKVIPFLDNQALARINTNSHWTSAKTRKASTSHQDINLMPHLQVTWELCQLQYHNIILSIYPSSESERELQKGIQHCSHSVSGWL